VTFKPDISIEKLVQRIESDTILFEIISNISYITFSPVLWSFQTIVKLIIHSLRKVKELSGVIAFKFPESQIYKNISVGAIIGFDENTPHGKAVLIAVFHLRKSTILLSLLQIFIIILSCIRY
jgi:hypothetical protein